MCLFDIPSCCLEVKLSEWIDKIVFFLFSPYALKPHWIHFTFATHAKNNRNVSCRTTCLIQILIFDYSCGEGYQWYMEIKKNHARNTLAGKPNALNILYPATFFCTLSVFIIWSRYLYMSCLLIFYDEREKVAIIFFLICLSLRILINL